MKCPHCEKDITGNQCHHCSSENPEEARYCMKCGSILGLDADEQEEIEQEDFGSEEGDDDLDLENRVLCPDGSCTGIIVKGKCTDCGRRG